MANYYYLTDDRKTMGPISLEQLRELSHQGVVRADTYVAKEGDPQWLHYAEAKLPQPLVSPIPIPPLADPGVKRSKPDPAGAASSAAAAQPQSNAQGEAAIEPANKKARAWLWILLGCLGLVAVLTAAGVWYFLKLAPLRTSEPYVISLARVQNNPQAVALLGGPPVQSGWLTMGEVTSHKEATGDENGTAKLSIPVNGAKSAGTVQVAGEKKAGVWLYSQIELRANGQSMDLRQEQEKAQTP